MDEAAEREEQNKRFVGAYRTRRLRKSRPESGAWTGEAVIAVAAGVIGYLASPAQTKVWDAAVGVLCGVVAIILYHFALRPIARYIWIVPVEEHVAQAERIHELESATRQPLVPEHHIRFKYSAVAFATRMGEEEEPLSQAVDVYTVLTRAELTNPDDKPTSVSFLLIVDLGGGLLMTFDPENEFWVSVHNHVEEKTGTKLDYCFSRVENIAARSATDGFLLFRFNGEALKQLDRAALNSGAMRLEARDLMSGHVETWHMTGTLMRLATERGVLPRKADTSSEGAES